VPKVVSGLRCGEAESEDETYGGWNQDGRFVTVEEENTNTKKSSERRFDVSGA
jgi:hypothetical protein